MPYRLNIPTIVTFNDLIPLIYPQYFNPLERIIFRIAHLLASRTAALVISISESTKADLIQYLRINPEKIIVIPLGVDYHFHPRSQEEIIHVRQRYALPEKYLLYLGMNKPHKNLGRLLKAFMQVIRNPQAAEVKLVIAGYWDDRYDGVKKMVEELDLKNHVLFVGSVEETNLPGLYSGATLFIFPSLYEGFGLPVLEAMACGTPVVCSNTSSLPEVVGNAAIQANPKDVHELATAIQSVLKDEELRHWMTEQGLRRATHFTWKKTAEETFVVYQQAMKRTP